MTATPRIILNNVSFQFDQSPVHFDRVNLSFDKAKYGLVGNNGVGKTTLLRLILGELIPDSGSIQCFGHVSDVPQSHMSIDETAKVSDALNVTAQLNALHNINNGCLETEYFDVMANHWDIEERVKKALNKFNLWPINLDTPFHQLSGGQKTKALLARALVFPADFFVFDEPTNNLDVESRNVVYDFIERTSNGMIIASHDRTVLNQCDRIIEITTKSIDIYGGNYDFFQEQKEIKRLAIEHELRSRKAKLTQSKQHIQTRMERHSQNESRGRLEKKKQIKGKGSYNKIELKAKQGKSENTNRRIRLQSERKLEAVNAELYAARAKIEAHKNIDIYLDKTAVPTNKTIIKIEDLCFGYDKNKPLIDHFNMQLTGPERVAIAGPNGCGKSTLIQLIRGILTPRTGNIFLGTEFIAYLDQTVNFLDPMLSIKDNFLKLNPKSKPFDAYSALASFKFRNKDAEKLVGNLSGGEKMRAGLAVSLMSSPPPQLIILDEPTNHLDLEAIEAMEAALKNYQGAILAVSHDETFLENIKINRLISINRAFFKSSPIKLN